MSFYESYVQLCNSVGKTPSAVAKEIGIQKSTVTHWSHGGNPSYSTKTKIANYFNTTVDLLDGNDSIQLSEEQQSRLWNVITQIAKTTNSSATQVIMQCKASSDLLRLEQKSYSRALKSQLFKIGDYYNVNEEIVDILSFPPMPLVNEMNLDSIDYNILFYFHELSPYSRNRVLQLFHNRFFPLNDQEISLISSWRKADDKARRKVAIELEDFNFSLSQASNITEDVG